MRDRYRTGPPPTAGFWIKLYAVSLAAFLVVDLVWLVVMSPRFYQPRLGSLMAAEVSWAPAILFYLLFVAGVLVLVVAPAVSQYGFAGPLARAALLGVVAYGTYDLTNLATLRDWPLIVTVVDMIWGGVLSVFVALVSLSGGRRLR